MPCCMSETLGWCKDLPVEYTDGKGNGFCIFHAPQGKKGLTTDEFNKAVFLYIDEQKKKNNRCNLAGTIFDGYIDFSSYHEDNPLPSITLSRVLFPFGAAFSETVFAKSASFTGAIFSSEADFGGSIFQERASFLNAYFKDGAEFPSARFEHEAIFAKAKFSGLVRFLNTRFEGSASFNGAKLDNDCYFYSSIFQKQASFSGTIFDSQVNFMKAIFLEDADFSDAIFKGRSDFSSTSFAGKTDFTFTTFKDRMYFKKTSFDGSALFHGVNLECVTFDNANLGKVSFLNSNLRKVDLVIPTWPKKHGRNILYDETEAKTEEDLKRVGLLYRMLKQKFKEDHDEAEASNWHYGEKEMYRKSRKSRRFIPFTLSNLYWFSSGYGERPVRAFLVFIFVFIALSFWSAFFGLECAKECCYGIENINMEPPYHPQLHQIGATMLNMMSYATFQKEVLFAPTTQWGYLVKIVSQILLPLQATLLGLAIRNRFRR